jgi:hypothetical protein|tara:strand:+ start:182 stop:379 length:198 start_codon:yes stop_codon:yes gene_type:complete
VRDVILTSQDSLFFYVVLQLLFSSASKVDKDLRFERFKLLLSIQVHMTFFKTKSIIVADATLIDF